MTDVLNINTAEEIKTAEKAGMMDWDDREDRLEMIREKLQKTQKPESDKSRVSHTKMGRPTLFKDDILKQAETLAGYGLTQEQMAEVWKVSDRSLRRWKKKNPEFGPALSRGKRAANLTMTQKLFKRGATDGDVVAIKYWLNNRDPENWKSDKAIINNQIINRVGGDPVENLDPKVREDILANFRETILRNAGHGSDKNVG